MSTYASSRDSRFPHVFSSTQSSCEEIVNSSSIRDLLREKIKSTPKQFDESSFRGFERPSKAYGRLSRYRSPTPSGFLSASTFSRRKTSVRDSSEAFSKRAGAAAFSAGSLGSVFPRFCSVFNYKKGLVIRSWPMLEPAPWPQTKPTSSPSGNSFCLIELISVAWLPPGRSVRPIEPANSTSPT
jgi:hypothetical protein